MAKNDGDPTPQPQPNPEPTPQPGDGNGDGDVLGKFKEIKERYESELSEKDKKIKELEDKLEKKEKEVDSTIQHLNTEVDEKLKQSEEYQKLLQTVQELEKDKAETTVDNLIKQGKILPVQKELALDFCLNDPDKFIKYYENAQPIVEVGKQKSKSVLNEKLGQMTNYFK